MSRITWSHHTSSQSASLAAGKISSRIQTLLINARRARRSLSGVPRRSSDTIILSTRMRQTALCRRESFWAAGYSSHVRWEGFLSRRPAAWDNLPPPVTATIDTDTFITSLKTYLFNLFIAYDFCKAPLATWWWSLAHHHLSVSSAKEICHIVTYLSFTISSVNVHGLDLG